MSPVLRTVAGAAVAASLAACGGGGSPSSSGGVPTPVPPTPTPVAIGPVDPAFVGRWSGSINGTVGVATWTVDLAANGTMTGEGSGSYCRTTGTWGVASGQFAARGEECQGHIVTFVAPAAATRLTGTWTASGGARGQFDVAR